MKKLLDSDWLRAVQFKCNTSAKSVTPVQITHRKSGRDNDWQKDNEKFCRPMISCKAVTKILYGNSEKRFSTLYAIGTPGTMTHVLANKTKRLIYMSL